MTKSATPIPEDALTLKMEERNWNLGAIGSVSSWPRLSFSLCHVVHCKLDALDSCASCVLPCQVHVLCPGGSVLYM